MSALVTIGRPTALPRCDGFSSSCFSRQRSRRLCRPEAAAYVKASSGEMPERCDCTLARCIARPFSVAMPMVALKRCAFCFASADCDRIPFGK